MFGTAHIIFAVAALAIGALVFLQKKGGENHRILGYLYSAALLLANLSALLVYEDSKGPGPFHVLALVSLATLSAGFVPALLRSPRNTWMLYHAYFMSWSYVGLVAVGVGQFATMLALFPGFVAVGLPALVIAVGGGVLIHKQVPRALVDQSRRSVKPE
ncbi:DUF2306 domain-containing protein [Microbulbifer sediminum]|uniref:DUF2306 domain-containing protein n=1 Tax=Microbulbifer sediminum TaxID=2904250 RepID=UPI001F1C116A|nr:DUF2306 domain-containing protein [Microbulbifer sediminum]